MLLSLVVALDAVASTNQFLETTRSRAASKNWFVETAGSIIVSKNRCSTAKFEFPNALGWRNDQNQNCRSRRVI